MNNANQPTSLPISIILSTSGQLNTWITSDAVPTNVRFGKILLDAPAQTQTKDKYHTQNMWLHLQPYEV